MIPKIFHLTAPTKLLSWEEKRMQSRLIRLLPEWEGHLWDDADNSALMQKAFPKLADDYEAIRFGVLKADIARCAYMHVYGGFYFDTDYKLIKAIDAELLTAQCVLPIEEGRPGSSDFKLGNAVFGSSAGHPLWSDFIHYIFRKNDLKNLTDHTLITAISGPRGLTTFFTEHRNQYSGIEFPLQDQFHPVRTFHGLSYKGNGDTYGLHLCWASWRGKTLTHTATNFLRRKLTAVI